MNKQEKTTVMSNENTTGNRQRAEQALPSSYAHASRRPWARRVARAMAFLLAAQSALPVLPAFAQSALPISPSAGAPAGQRPIMDAANNGVPIVHVAPPSAAGVSRNQYEQFNVNPNGLILNNSTGNAQTQLGGWVTGNLQLGPTPARIILNEVVSASTSQLRGTIEVAGQRADIVIANPNGITCDGCGFLNANRASLTTGQPQFGSGGSIEGFDVRQGELTVGGNGLNASNLEQLDLIARGIVIEGEVWAQNLKVIAGANQVLYGTLQAAAQSGTGAVPRFAIDIKDLGGMYANQVYMIATEQGLGVNSTGRMAALQGNLVLSANGDLRLQDTYARQNVQIAGSGNVTLAGQTQSEASTTVSAATHLANQGVLDAGGRLSLDAASINNTGTVAQRNTEGVALSTTGQVSNSGTLYSAGQLDVNAGGISDDNGVLLAAGDVRLQAQSIELTGTRITTEGSARLAAGAGLTAQQSDIRAAADLSVTAGTAIINTGSAWQAAGNASIAGASLANRGSTVQTNGRLEVNAGGAIDNIGGRLLAGGNVVLQAQSLTNDHGQIVSDAGTDVRLAGPLKNESGTILSNGNLQIAAAGGAIDNTAGTLFSNAGLVIDGANLGNAGGVIASGGQQNGALTIRVAGLSNNNGIVDAAGTLELTSTGAVDNSYGILQSGSNAASTNGGASIESASLVNSGGRILARDAITVITGELNNDLAGAQQGIIASIKAGTTVQAAQASNVGGLITAAGDSSVRTQFLNNTGGEISAGAQLSVDTGGNALTSNGGSLLAGSDLEIRSGAISNNKQGSTAGNIVAAGNVSIQGASFSNDGSILSAGQLASVTVGEMSNQGGRMEAQDTITVNAGILNNRSGQLIANNAVSLDAGSVDSTDGVISAGDTVTVSSTGALTNVRGRIVANRTVEMAAASLDNSSGTVSARDNRVQLGTGLLNNTQGLVIGSEALAIQSGEIRNGNGTMASGSGLALDTQGRSLNNAGGQIVANNDLRIDSASLNNGTGTIASIAGKLDIGTQGQDLVNDSGKLQALGDVTLASGAFRNQGGLVSGQQITSIAASFDNQSGRIAASGNLDIRSEALGNDAGLLQAIGNVVIDAQGRTVTNTNSGSAGGIVAGGELNIAAGSLDNRAGFVGSDGNQTLAVAGDIDNRAATGQAGQLVTNANGTITAANVLNAGGRISTLGELAVSTGILDNRAGQVAAGGATVLTVTTLDNSMQGAAGGAIDADTFAATATAINNNGGAIRSARDATVTAAALTNAGGTVSAKVNLSMTAASLSNTGGTLVGDAGVVVTTSSSSPGGTIASANNVTLNVNGNYSNSGLLSAQRNLTVNASNITNSGTLTAGNVLTANTGNLTNSGEISADTTNLNVSGTLTNTATGLIDGVHTNINAATTNNTGRIYGDVLSIKGSAVNNSGTGTIAARNTLSIGAQQISNTNGGLFYSLGNLNMAGGLDANGNLVGQAQQLVNGSARIEAAGNMNLAVANLYNRNDAFSTRTVTSVEALNKTYIQPNGSVEKYDPTVLGWDARYKEWSGRYVLPSSTYPIAQFGAIAIELSNGPYCISWGDFQPCPEIHNYPPEHPIWALFNVAPPYTGDLVMPVLPYAYGNCTTYNDGGTSRILYGACGTYWQAFDTYYNTLAQRVWDAERALDAKIMAFNADVESRSFEAWNEYQITGQTTSETVIDSTRPAQILAGGSITIEGDGNKLNDNSQIIAGGAITIGGTSVTNPAIDGTRSITEEGQVRFRRIEHHGGFSDSYEIELHPWYATTGAPQVETFPLAGYLYAAYGGNQTATRNLTVQAPALSGATSVAIVLATGQDRAINTAAANTTLPGTVAADIIAKTPLTIQKLEVTGTGTQAPSVILSTLPRMSAPSGSLFVLHPEPAARYLVETDPRFTNYRTFLSSDYFLQALNRDPEKQLKRYGDGFYEQQLVNDQILALTGRRYLSGYSDTQTEYQALMDAGIAFARQYQISPGVTLSAEQMALLTTDIVWLTVQTVTLADGRTQQVLVPQVYLRRPQDGDLQQSGALIAGSDITIRTEEDLVNSGTIAADRSSTLIAGRDLVNQGGRISGQDIFAYATNDLKNLSGVIQGSGDNSQVALFAGRDIVLQTRTIASSTEASATTTASRRTSVDRIATVQGGDIRLAAARDLNAQGSLVDTQRDLLVTAGRDIKVTSVAGSYQLNVGTGGLTQGRTGYIKEETTTNQVAAFKAGNDMALAAANDISLKGADLTAGNDLLLQGANVSIEAAVDRKMDDVQNVRTNAYNRSMRDDETLAGGNVTAGNNLTVIATGKEEGSGNIAIRGAYLSSEAGQVAAVASGDITVGAMTTEHVTIDESYLKMKGALSTVITERSSTSTLRQVEGSVITGNSVVMSAGTPGGTAGNVTIAGSSVVADGDIALDAAKDVTIITAQQTFDSKSSQEERKSGLFGSGGASATWGKQQTNQDQTLAEVTHVGSAVASLGGNVSINAGQNYAQTGSQLLAEEGNIDVAAKRIDITAATDNGDSVQETRFKQSGLTLALSSPIISALESIQQKSEAAGKTKDKRMQALAAATAVAEILEAAAAAAKLAEGATSNVVNISLTVGSKSSESKQTQSSTSAVGSTVEAGGDITLQATGDGKDSSIAVIGSDIRAGNNATLKAEGDIDLRAAQSTLEQHSTNQSNSSGVGIAISVDSSGSAAFGITAQASAARGNADGRDVIHSNTHVEAGNRLTIDSGGDTNLAGAVASGGQVAANVGGNLNIESLQDTSVYKSRDQSAGGSVTAGYGFSASASYSKTEIDADFASVIEQSGISAGDGGFQIDVKGNTDLKGGAIAGSEQSVKENRNSLSTVTLTQSDIVNRAEFSASSVSLAGSVSVSSNDGKEGEGGKPAEGIQWRQFGNEKATSVGFGSESGSESSVTRSGISGSTLVITDSDKQQKLTGQDAGQAVAAVDRNIVSGQDSGGVAKNWDAQQLKDEVTAQAQITQAFGAMAAKKIGDFAKEKYYEAEAKAKEAADRNDTAKEAEYKAEMEKWKEGGAYRVALHVAAGGLSGGVNGAMGAAGAAGAAQVLNGLEADAKKALEGAGLSAGSADALAKGLTNLVATGVGAAVGGTAGAATALNVDANNRQLHLDEIKWIQRKSTDFAKKLFGTDTPTDQQLAQAEAYLTYAAMGNVDNGDQKANVLVGLGKDENYIEAKKYLVGQPDTFVNDKGQVQRVFTVKGNEFYDPLKYSNYNADPAYRDFMWNTVGVNYAPPANASAQEKALYAEREKQRLVRDVKSGLPGLVTAGVLVGVAKIHSKVNPVVIRGATDAPGELPNAFPKDLGRTVEYEGTRIYDPKYGPYSSNPDASNRYSAPQVDYQRASRDQDLYLAPNQATANAEMRYKVDGKDVMTAGVRQQNVLDLTDVNVQQKLNVDVTKLTTNTGMSRIDYAYTQEISRKAYEAGYTGIIYPSAQNPGNSNMMVFGGRYDSKEIQVIDVKPAQLPARPPLPTGARGY